MEELEQQWRAEAEAKREAIEEEVRGEIPHAGDTTIEEMVSAKIIDLIDDQRRLHERTVRNTAMRQRAQEEHNARQAREKAQRTEQCKRIREETLPLLSREDAEASHTIKAAKTTKDTSDVACEAVYSKYETAANDLMSLGEAQDAIPLPEEVIPNVFAERQAQAQAAQAQALAPPPPVLSLLPPDGASSGATEGDLVCLEKIVSTAVPGVERRTRKELRIKFVSWLNSLSGKFDRLGHLIEIVNKYEAKLASFLESKKKEQERGKTPPKRPLLLPDLKEASALRKLLEAMHKRLPYPVDDPVDGTAPPDPPNEGKGAANDAQAVDGADTDDADEATQGAGHDDEATQRADDVADSAVTHSDSSTQTEPMPEMPPPPRPITEEEVKGSKWNKKLAQELEIKTKELADRNDRLSQMGRQMCELQDKHDPTQQSRLIDSLRSNMDALKDELDAAKKKIKDLEAVHGTHTHPPSNSESLTRRSNAQDSAKDSPDAPPSDDESSTPTLTLHEREMLIKEIHTVKAQAQAQKQELLNKYIKHIKGLTFKCLNKPAGCGLVSLSSQKGCCHNKACRKHIDAESDGTLKITKPALLFNFTDLLNQAGQEESAFEVESHR
ncbi:hypothetical protein EMVG_00187 [Emiliania huxleyi virus PS401]|nr:hypothetical protein EMVG_00187 [Emiliania huxleyi virus PS401]